MKSVLNLAMALGLLSLGLFITGCNQNPDAIYANAVRIMEEGRMDRAETLLLNVLEIKADHQNALYALGVLYMKQDRYAEAITRFRAALEVNPDDAEALINLGVIHARLGQNREAEDAYMKAIVKSPGNSTVLLNLARLYAKQQKLREARLLYEKILRSQPALYTANKELAYVYKAEDKLAEAIEQFSRTLKLNRKDAEVLYELGSLNFKRGNLTSASKFFLGSLAVKEDAEVYLALGHLYQRSQNYSEAILAFQKAYDLKRDSYEATFRLAVLFLHQGEAAKAEAEVQEALAKAERYCLIALELNRQSAEAHKLMGIIHYRFYRNDASIQSFQKARELNVYVRETNYYQGMISLRNSDKANAVQFFLKELMEDPSSLKSARELASVYYEFEEWEKGVKLLKNSLKLAPDDVQILTLLGLFHLQLADAEKAKSGLYTALELYDEAIVAFRDALKIEPARMDALRGVLTALESARRHAVAVPYLEKMIELRPEELQYYSRLALGYSANQDYVRAVEILRRYLAKRESDAEVWFQLGKVYADKGDFLEGIEIFQKSINLDSADPRKKMYLGMLYAEVNKFEDALKTLQMAMDQAANDEATRRRCEDLIRQILEVSGLSADKVNQTLTQGEVTKIKQSKPKLVAGTKPYVRAMLYSVLQRMTKARKEGNWTPEFRRQTIAMVRLRLIKNYRQLASHNRFKDAATRRFYFLGIKKLIAMLRQG